MAKKKASKSVKKPARIRTYKMPNDGQLIRRGKFNQDAVDKKGKRKWPMVKRKVEITSSRAMDRKDRKHGKEKADRVVKKALKSGAEKRQKKGK